MERYIRRGNPRATRDLSEGGAELYDRLISEGCAYVIEIADKLPRFQTNAFAELMSAPRTCPDRVRAVPAVAEIPISARGWDAGRSCVVTTGGRGTGRLLVQRLARDLEQR